MRHTLCSSMLLALLWVVPARALASPLEVRTAGSASQTITMCPSCGTSGVCARPGDFELRLTVDLRQPYMGNARLAVRVTTRSGVPVDDAGVLITLTTPEQGRLLLPLTAKRQAAGEYAVLTDRLNASGLWTADVAVTTAKGDTVHQQFTFKRPRIYRICVRPDCSERGSRNRGNPKVP